MRVILTALVIASLCACDSKSSTEPKPVEASGASGAAVPPADKAAGAAQAAGEVGAAAEGGQAAVETDTSGTPPADFPVPIPAGVKGTFLDDTAEGRRSRMANFQYTGSSEEFAALCEKAVRAKGLEPRVQKKELGTSHVVEIDAAKGDIEIEIAILTQKSSGASLINVSWTEPAP